MRVSIKKLMNEITQENRIKAAVDYLSEVLVKPGPYKGKVFAAGGFVRDRILGKQAKDVDLVINEKNGGIRFAEWACQKMGNFKRDSNPVVFPTFGTAKFVLRGIVHQGIDLSEVDIECVMPRVEEYDGKTRKPTVAQGTLEQDVMRRDFTVNSLLLDLTTGQVLDLTGKGVADIKAGIIRTTDADSDVIFDDDPLRMLRAVRFMVREGWNIDPETIESIKRNAPKLSKISSERITSELDKMLTTSKPELALRTLQQLGLLKFVMPEAESMIGVTQNKFHDDDVWDHTMKVVAGTPPKLVTRLAALFHDMAKPVTKSVVDSEVHFYKHEMVGAELARSIMMRLKYPTAVIEPVVAAVKNHMRLKQAGENGQVVSDKALRKLQNDLGPHLHDILDLMQSDNMAHSELGRQPNQIPGIKNRLGSLETPAGNKIKLPIDGNDLILRGFKGTKIGAALEAIKDAWFENPHITKDQALELVKDLPRI